MGQVLFFTNHSEHQFSISVCDSWFSEYFFLRIHPSADWIQSQIPEFIKSGTKGLRADDDIDEMDAEAFVQAYVNIVAGTCISLGMLLILVFVTVFSCVHFSTILTICLVGLRFAGTKDKNAQELLYEYAMYFLNEVSHVLHGET